MNWTSLTRVTRSETPLIDVETAIAHCRASDEDEETIARLIEVATDFISGPSGIGTALLTEEWKLSLDSLPSVIELDLTPVQSVDSVTYVDEDGVTQTVDPATYYVDVDQRPAIVAFIATRPITKAVPGAVKVHFTAGYGAPADVPADLRHAALLLISHYFENREAVQEVETFEVPMGVERILRKYRVA
jgi:hypothetical protein